MGIKLIMGLNIVDDQFGFWGIIWNGKVQQIKFCDRDGVCKQNI